MLTLDVFNQDPFSAINMTGAVDKLGYVPGFLGSIPGLFEPVPVDTTDIFIEDRGNAPALIQTSPRGTPPANSGAESRAARSFKTVRVAKKSHITAAQLQNIRAFGTQSELMTLQIEVARRQLLLRRDVELTMENLRMGCVMGKVVDADGSTIYDWEAEFGQTIPNEIDFDLDNASPASGVVRKKCETVRRSVIRGLKGLGGDAVGVVGLAGDAFWDDFIAHSEVRETYLATQEAADLRKPTAFGQFTYGGITFVNYRGTDDLTTVGVNTDKCKFFPTGAGIFQMAQAPAERFEFVNTMGKELYSWVVLDKDRNSWADVEMYSYPLPVCTMPQALHRAKRT